jgi:predicted PurR-regulated permease PerM
VVAARDYNMADTEATAAETSTAQHPLGRPNKPLDRRSPFFIGLSGAAGVAVMAGIVEMIITVRDVLVLVGLALFLAVGLEPAVSVLARRKVPRWAAVIIVLVALLAVAGGFLAAAIPPLVRQATQFVAQAPTTLPKVLAHYPVVNQLANRLHLQQHLQRILSGNTPGVFNGLLGAGEVVFSALAAGGRSALRAVTPNTRSR